MKTNNTRKKSGLVWVKPKKKKKILSQIELPEKATVKERAKITVDARGLLLVRIPRKIEQAGKITKNDFLEFEVTTQLASKKKAVKISLVRENEKKV